MVHQLISRLELPLAHIAVVKIFRIRRVDLFVDSQDSLRLQFQATDVAFELPLERMDVTDVRVQICFT